MRPNCNRRLSGFFKIFIEFVVASKTNGNDEPNNSTPAIFVRSDCGVEISFNLCFIPSIVEIYNIAIAADIKFQYEG